MKKFFVPDGSVEVSDIKILLPKNGSNGPKKLSTRWYLRLSLQLCKPPSWCKIGAPKFPTDDSLLKMLYLAMVDITTKWTGRRQDWSVIHTQLAVFFLPDRMSK